MQRGTIRTEGGGSPPGPMVPPLQNSITISKSPPRPEAGKSNDRTDVDVIAQRELTTLRLDLRPAGPYGSMQGAQLGLTTLVDEAWRRQLIGGGEVEQQWRRRSHRQN